MNVPFFMWFHQSGKSLLCVGNPFRSMNFELNHKKLRRRTPLCQQSCTHTHDSCRRLPFQTRCREESRLCIQHCLKRIGDRVHLTHTERATQMWHSISLSYPCTQDCSMYKSIHSRCPNIPHHVAALNTVFTQTGCPTPPAF